MPWGFATRFSTLQLISNVTPGWCFTYGSPADCLAAREIIRNLALPDSDLVALGFVGATNVNGLTGVNADLLSQLRAYQVPFQTVENEEGGGLAIATNEPNATLMYTARVTAYTLWTPAFVNCVTLLLASKIVGPLANNPEYAAELGKAYEVALLKAGASSMNEQKERPEPDSEFVITRG
jgi:hypothetical protein